MVVYARVVVVKTEKVNGSGLCFGGNGERTS